MTLVVGFSPGKDDWSSIELGATLARSANTDLLAVTVVPSVWPTPVAGHTDREFEDWAEQQGAAAVAEAKAILAEHCPDVAAVARCPPGRDRRVAAALLPHPRRRGDPRLRRQRVRTRPPRVVCLPWR
jgi:hypothetical protein